MMRAPVAVPGFDRRTLLLAILLSVLAGFVDSIGFIALGGFFVSFMSGNSTRMAVGLVLHGHDAVIAGSLITTFVIGVTGASLIRRLAAEGRRKVVSLCLLSGLLLVAALVHMAGGTGIALYVMALAMGAENTVFERDGEIVIGLTYMTGALVKFGQRLATALAGGDRFGWVPWALLWAGLTSGAIAGALLYRSLGLHAVWLAAAWAIGITLWRISWRPAPDPAG